MVQIRVSKRQKPSSHWKYIKVILNPQCYGLNKKDFNIVQVYEPRNTQLTSWIKYQKANVPKSSFEFLIPVIPDTISTFKIEEILRNVCSEALETLKSGIEQFNSLDLPRFQDPEFIANPREEQVRIFKEITELFNSFLPFIENENRFQLFDLQNQTNSSVTNTQINKKILKRYPTPEELRANPRQKLSILFSNPDKESFKLYLNTSQHQKLNATVSRKMKKS
ncbi:MAG: hypothetical protein QNJ31_09495 [Candidatus Caenarcaniphilales bacterium]|nr:hypothetical protein [Candidatus Caenarcaniphilales bacterium]